jgi:hypothetical protein
MPFAAQGEPTLPGRVPLRLEKNGLRACGRRSVRADYKGSSRQEARGLRHGRPPRPYLDRHGGQKMSELPAFPVRNSNIQEH